MKSGGGRTRGSWHRRRPETRSTSPEAPRPLWAAGKDKMRAYPGDSGEQGSVSPRSGWLARPCVSVGRLEAASLVLGFPFPYNLLGGTWLAVLGRLIPRNCSGLRVPLVEVLLQFREVFLRGRSNQTTLTQCGFSLFLAREVVRDGRRVLGSSRRRPLDGRRIDLPCSGRFEFARKFLKEAIRLLLIRGSLSEEPLRSIRETTLNQNRFLYAPRAVIPVHLFEDFSRGRWKWFNVE